MIRQYKAIQCINDEPSWLKAWGFKKRGVLRSLCPQSMAFPCVSVNPTWRNCGINGYWASTSNSKFNECQTCALRKFKVGAERHGGPINEKCIFGECFFTRLVGDTYSNPCPSYSSWLPTVLAKSSFNWCRMSAYLVLCNYVTLTFSQHAANNELWSLPRYFQTVHEPSVQNTFTEKNPTFMTTHKIEHRVKSEIHGSA
jgi:hypothetical protein